MGLFNNTGVSSLELSKQKVHLLNDYLQPLNDLLGVTTANEDDKLKLLNELIALVETIEGLGDLQLLEKSVSVLTNMTAYAKSTSDNYAGMVKLHKNMLDKGNELFKQYEYEASRK